MSDDRWFCDDSWVYSDMNRYLDTPLATIRYWSGPSVPKQDPGCIRDVDFVTELVHEIERLQGEVIERDTAIDDAMRYHHDMDWRKVLAPFYEADR